jgi:hypothetical protein
MHGLSLLIAGATLAVGVVALILQLLSYRKEK